MIGFLPRKWCSFFCQTNICYVPVCLRFLLLSQTESVEKLRWKLTIIGLLFRAVHLSFKNMVFCPESEIGTTNSQQWICEITMHQARLSVHFIRPEIEVGITDRQGKHALTNQKLLYIWTAARCKFHFSMSLWLVLSLIFLPSQEF